MSAIVRIFRKDLRRFWPFSALLVAAAVVTSWFPSLGMGYNASRAIATLDDLRDIGICVLMLFLVLDDPVASDRAAWITRPIGGGAMLAAKALYLIATILLPFALTTFAACLHLRLAMSDALVVTGLATIRFGFVAAAFGFVAGMSRNFLGAAAVVCGGLVALAAIVPYLPLVTTSPIVYNFGNASWRSTTVAVALFLGLLLFLYRTRRIRATAYAAVAAGVALLFSLQALDEPIGALKPVPGLTLRPTHAPSFIGAAVGRPFPLADALVVAVELRQQSDADHDYVAFPERGRFTDTRGRHLAAMLSDDDAIRGGDTESRALSTPWSRFGHICRTAYHVTPPARQQIPYTPLLRVSSSHWQAWSGATGSLETLFSVADSEYHGQGSIPARVGAVAPIPGYRATVHRIRYVGDGTLQVAFDVQLIAMRSFGSASALWALVNDQTGEVSLQEFGRNLERAYTAGYVLESERITASFAHRWRPGESRVAEGGLTREWVDRARLAYVLVSARKVADTALTLPGFQLPTIGGGR